MMRRMLVTAGAVVALAGCAMGISGGGGGNVPPQFIGRWVGVGVQSDSPDEWTIDATIVGGPVQQVGTIAYPSLECGGVLLFLGVRDGRLELREDITYGSCIDQGITTLTPMAGGGLRYDWRLEGSDLTAEGTLTRAR